MIIYYFLFFLIRKALQKFQDSLKRRSVLKFPEASKNPFRIFISQQEKSGNGKFRKIKGYNNSFFEYFST